MKNGHIVEQILQLLRDYGPMTRADLSLHMPHGKALVSSIVSRLCRDLPRSGRRLHVHGWVEDAEGGRRYPRAVYALGDAPDRPKPARSKAANSRRYRQARSLRAINSVFALARAPRGMKLF